MACAIVCVINIQTYFTLNSQSSNDTGPSVSPNTSCSYLPLGLCTGCPCPKFSLISGLAPSILHVLDVIFKEASLSTPNNLVPLLPRP